MSSIPVFRWPYDRGNPRLLERLAPADSAIPASVIDDARAIIAAVRSRGDAALVEYSARFDHVELKADRLRVGADEIAESAARASSALREALELAIANVRAFHQQQRPSSYSVVAPGNATLELLWRPVGRAALYVPGGRAAYPSSVVMNAVPALVAGVERIAVFTVPGTIEANPAVACALQLLGLTEVYRVGGAQAIAAAAWGTQSIEPVDVITGPGNAWVAAAKREVFGRVGIDSIAGPSEVLILADESTNSTWAALDLLAQAEHDPLARVVLASTSAHVVDAVAEEVERLTEIAERSSIIREALRDRAVFVVADDDADLREIVAEMGPEHLQVMMDRPFAIDDLVAGAIFVGNHAPTAIGDYIAGPNHVLPTGGSARHAGPLGVLAFMRPTSVVRGTQAMMDALASSAAVIADQENLAAHALALRARIGEA